MQLGNILLALTLGLIPQATNLYNMSAQPSRIDGLLEANRKFAENYTKPMEMTMMRQGSEPILVRKQPIHQHPQKATHCSVAVFEGVQVLTSE